MWLHRQHTMHWIYTSIYYFLSISRGICPSPTPLVPGSSPAVHTAYTQTEQTNSCWWRVGWPSTRPPDTGIEDANLHKTKPKYTTHTPRVSHPRDKCETNKIGARVESGSREASYDRVGGSKPSRNSILFILCTEIEQDSNRRNSHRLTFVMLE